MRSNLCLTDLKCSLFLDAHVGGLGGFSQGAIASGASVIEGYDCDAIPLKLFAANVPGVRAVRAKLGPNGDTIDLPPAAPDLHIHASTPCTELSSAKHSATDKELSRGEGMLRWALELFRTRGDFSWSIENVSTPTTRRLLQEYKDTFPEAVDFSTLDAVDFGAPQNRNRLIAGPPWLIKLLEEMPASQRLSVRAAFVDHGLELPSAHFKNQTRNRDGTACVRSVEDQCFTICASHPLTFCDRNGSTVRVMKPQEGASLMGFSTQWRLPTGQRNAQRAIGNALCVAMSTAIMNAVVSYEPTLYQLSQSMVLSDTPCDQHSTTGSETPHNEYRRLRKRLRTIETLVRELHSQSCDDPRADEHLLLHE